MAVDPADLRHRFATSPVARMATVTEQGRPHIVPCCFAVHGDSIVTAVDGKPKSTLALRRLDNVRSNPAVSFVVDHYDDDDWSQLWWVRADGEARVVEAGPDRDAGIAALVAKYEQYRQTPPPGAVIVAERLRWRAWP